MHLTLHKVVNSKVFTNTILFIILLNSILIGIQVTMNTPIIDYIQKSILFIFTVEIIVRWLGRSTVKAFVKDPWNWFDSFLVVVSLLPNSIFTDASTLSALRVLRVLRVLRLLKVIPELQIMVRVLVKSISSVIYALLLLLIFMYIYSIIGVILFKGVITVVTAHTDNIDPFGSLAETFFSLFRISTGEDWTDLRYDMMNSASTISYTVVNIYFISWYIVSSLLLMNIVFGAIISNYEKIYREGNKEDDEYYKLREDISRLEDKLDKLMEK